MLLSSLLLSLSSIFYHYHCYCSFPNGIPLFTLFLFILCRMKSCLYELKSLCPFSSIFVINYTLCTCIVDLFSSYSFENKCLFIAVIIVDKHGRWMYEYSYSQFLKKSVNIKKSKRLQISVHVANIINALWAPVSSELLFHNILLLHNLCFA